MSFSCVFPLFTWAWMMVMMLLAVFSTAKYAAADVIEVSGKAIDAGTGKPVGKFVEQDGRVDPKDPSKVIWGFSEGRNEGENPGGTFRVTIDWAGGQRVRLLADGYLPQPILVEPPPEGAKAVSVTVVMKRGREIAGTVVDAKGKPVADASVFLVGKRQVNLTGGKATRDFDDGGEDKTVTRALTESDGHFTVSGAGEDVTRLAVSCAVMDLWIVPVPKTTDAEKPLVVRLPEPGRLTIKYDIPGSAPEGVFFLQMLTHEIPEWLGIDNIRKPRQANGTTQTLANLAPGAYEITRSKQVRLSSMGFGSMLDRQRIVIRPGGAAEAVFARDRGAAITGRVDLPDRDKSAGVHLFVKKADDNDYPFGTVFESMKAEPDGTFTTERLLPGDYKVIVQAYRPEPEDQRFVTGLRGADLTGSAKVTVPATGKPEAVVITLKPPAKPRAK
ncbi:MAG: hypothetical protein JWN86_3914 [Planctomycetota bacterium]|nr:hypothetical protein [Planctomycetota bacterium]